MRTTRGTPRTTIKRQLDFTESGEGPGGVGLWPSPYERDASGLSAFAQIRAFNQMLVRAGLRTILITQE
ncbi:MAG: hypothetical protein M3R24_29050 [Chloroflexota bacterium]|nr:hypothetical protein [Chloroflexota bacterium]